MTNNVHKHTEPTTKIILLAGESCSGKTTLCKKIREEFQNSANGIKIISIDSYYQGTGDPHMNYDEPQAIEWQRLLSDINNLLNGNIVNIPQYDFTTHMRKNESIVMLPCKIIIIEGIFAFNNSELLKLAECKILVKCDPREVVIRRFMRDQTERGRDVIGIATQYRKFVLPGTIQYLNPTEGYADIIINNNDDNKFQGLKILKPYLKTLIMEYNKEKLE